MMGPPELLTVSRLITTSGAANTISAFVTLLTPAPDERIRVWAAHLGGLTSRTGTLWIELSGSGAGAFLELNAPVGGADALVLPGGLPLGPGVVLQIRDSSNAATQSVRCWVYYTIELMAA